ncbi:T9SS type A sorting domain-containing protein [Xanthomarina sp. F1114]|uniref:T9SS type A sorting domain-containing protein n=1 Tax=Xanthomarina sp. F1114 TaxID=2996019 RepID=UPI00225E31E9|nr:T9SS type A sorting domain-containing protein [Xanthomarina sp. F1114]MCX7547105.1 T9SS type A sorting domain-containing protein [Xanthomarina sp. F1114]
MNTKLPILFFLISLFTYGQTPINSFYSVPESYFAVVTSSTAVDQSASGADLTWDFTNLTSVGTVQDTYDSPTPEELIAYPGTTSVLTITETATTTSSKIFTREVAAEVSFTGAESSGLDLNYTTNNGVIGTFPLSYGSNNTDAVSGSFNYETYSGTFTGNIVTTVDAYGTLNMNDVGEGAYSGPVTRLKVVQTLNLTYLIPNVGTVTQTSYFYYDANDGTLVFRTNTVDVVVSLLGINETITVMESYLSTTIGISDNQIVNNEFRIIPNPVSEVLNIRLNQNESIRSITLTDLSGRQVLHVNSNLTSISVNHLQTGMYIANIITDKGVYSKRVLKK